MISWIGPDGVVVSAPHPKHNERPSHKQNSKLFLPARLLVKSGSEKIYEDLAIKEEKRERLIYIHLFHWLHNMETGGCKHKSGATTKTVFVDNDIQEVRTGNRKEQLRK